MAILKLLDVGVVFVDNDRNLVFANRRALNTLDIAAPSPRGQDFARYYTELGIDDVFLDGKACYDTLVSLGKQKLVVTTLPVSTQGKMRGAVALIRDAASIRSINNKIRDGLRLRGLTARHTLGDIKGESPAIKRLAHKIAMYAPTCSSVLVEGESGSGKELAAHALHNLSRRKDRPFVAVNCSALPESLMESELFGYEEGAFTGAKRGGKVGLFELANQGTIFLDEIGEISHGVQLRLLRVLEAKEIMRVEGIVSCPWTCASSARQPQVARAGAPGPVPPGSLLSPGGVATAHAAPASSPGGYPLPARGSAAALRQVPGVLSPGMMANNPGLRLARQHPGTLGLHGKLPDPAGRAGPRRGAVPGIVRGTHGTRREDSPCPASEQGPPTSL